MSSSSMTFDSIGCIPSASEVKSRINRRYDALFYKDANGFLRTYVCSVCDKIIMHEKDLMWFSFDKLKACQECLNWDSVHEYRPCQVIGIMKENYQFPTVPVSILSDSLWLKKLALSPRGSYGRKGTGRSKWGVSCCCQCHSAVSGKKTPLYAIVNNNFFGNAPECLRELTPVELAMITPVTGHGWCFSWVGGTQKNLKGTLSFMRVDQLDIARAVTQMKVMGLTSHVVVLLTGKVTKSQRDKVTKKIRTDKVITAVEWLVRNNVQWQSFDLSTVQKELETHVPVVVDQSTTVESENANVENKELLTCYFLDGSTTTNNGGFDNMETFKEYVKEMQRKNYDMSLKLDLDRQFLNGSDSDQLMSSSLLNFPYGLCGLNEKRLNSDGSWSVQLDILDFIKHLSSLSSPEFHMPLFQLILYSMGSKVRLLRKSRLQLKGDYHAESIAKGLESSDLKKAIASRRIGNRNGGSAGARNLLLAVDAMSKALPHSNEAASAARGISESMLHHFGSGSIFLTVTFDDENSLLMEVLTGKNIESELEDGSNLSDQDLERELHSYAWNSQGLLQ